MALCKCGCKREANPTRRFIAGHQNYMKVGEKHCGYIPREDRLCSCGCGKFFRCRVDSKQRYISGHNMCKKAPYIKLQSQLCLCGCGQMASPGKRYLLSHYFKLNPPMKGRTGNKNPKYILREWRVCKCGACEEIFECQKISDQKYLPGHYGKVVQLGKRRIPREIRLCACGCGQSFECKENDPQRYIIYHAVKMQWKDPEQIEGARIRRSKQIFPFKDTSIELAIQQLLVLLNVPFEKHRTLDSLGIISRFKYHQVDIVIPGHKLIIECDGDYWHDYPEGTEKDSRINEDVENSGWRMLRLWENEIKNDLDVCMQRISVNVLQ